MFVLDSYLEDGGDFSIYQIVDELEDMFPGHKIHVQRNSNYIFTEILGPWMNISVSVPFSEYYDDEPEEDDDFPGGELWKEKWGFK